MVQIQKFRIIFGTVLAWFQVQCTDYFWDSARVVQIKKFRIIYGDSACVVSGSMYGLFLCLSLQYKQG